MADRGDSGRSFVEYLAVAVLAALILSGLVVTGIPAKLGGGVGTVICQIVGGKDCEKKNSGGENGADPTSSPDAGSTPGASSSPDASGSPNATDDPGDASGDDPSLADLEKQADDAQKAADKAATSPGNIMKQIIDLLKDFIGITDIEECITQGKISSCLWAALDVGSLFFAALKIAKFAKAVKGAIKLFKAFSKGRKALARAKAAAKRAKALLKKKRLACGLPAGYHYPNAPPGRVVHAAFSGSRPSYANIATVTIARAGPGTCKLNPKRISDELAKAKKTGRAGLQAHESLGGHTLAEHVGKSKKAMLDRLRANPNLPSTSSFSSYKTADKAVGKALKDNDKAIQNWLSGKDKGFRLTKVPAGGKVGSSVARNGSRKVAKNVTVVLQKDSTSPDGYRILTSYPEV